MNPMHKCSSAVSAICALMLGWCGQGSAADLNVKVADHFPPGHIIPATMLKPWMAKVEEFTAKKVRFTHFPAQQLVKQNEALSAVQRRVVDIVLINPGLFPTEFALTGVAFLPNGYDTVVHGGKALQELFKQPAVIEEFRKAGLRVLLIEPLDAYEALTNRPVNRPADLKGFKIRAAGEGQLAATRALGATPATIAAPEMYTSVQRGTIEGVLFGYSISKSYKLDEVAKFGTLGANIAYAHVLYCVTEASWSSWPADVQAAMTKAAAEIMPKAWQDLDKSTTDVIAAFQKSGVKITDVRKNGTAKEWQDLLKPVNQQWAESMKAKGLPGPEVLAAWEKALAATH
jgi:TRAP-type C4-dicarboxylate transport system substrate-binding protein